MQPGKHKVGILNFTLTDNENNIMDQTNDASFNYLHGTENIIPGLENALVGMSEGDEGDIMVKSTDAYGEINEEAFQVLPRDQFAGVDLIEGMTLYGQAEDGQQTQVIVKTFDDSEVNVDFNHPLAGKDLMFSVKVLTTREATADEIATSVIGGKPAQGESCGTGCGCH